MSRWRPVLQGHRGFTLMWRLVLGRPLSSAGRWKYPVLFGPQCDRSADSEEDEYFSPLKAHCEWCKSQWAQQWTRILKLEVNPDSQSLVCLWHTGDGRISKRITLQMVLEGFAKCFKVDSHSIPATKMQCIHFRGVNIWKMRTYYWRRIFIHV
jgi:hypothetical protein